MPDPGTNPLAPLAPNHAPGPYGQILRMVLYAANAGTWEWDPHDQKSYWSDEVWTLLGLPRHLPPSFDTYRDCIHPEDRPAFDEIVRHIAEGGPSRCEMTFRIIRPDGEIIRLMDVGERIREPDPRAGRWVGILMDVTALQFPGERLARNESLFRGIFEDAPIGMALISRDGRPVRVNQALAGLLGRSREELTGLALKDFTHPDEREADWHLFHQLFTGEINGYVLERRLVRPDGSIVRARIKCVRIPDNDEIIFGTAEDVTLQRENEEDLRRRVDQRTEQIQLQAAAMDNALDGMSVLVNDHFVYLNPAHARIYGYEPGEMIGMSWRQLHPPEEVRMFEERVRPLVATSGSWRGEVKALRKDGSLFDVEICLIRAPNGTLVCCCRDISVAKRAERDLRHRGEELERATRLKDEFLASMSHELRTPLAGILGFSEVLRTGIYGPLPPKQLEAVKAIEDSGRHLLAMINDILDLAKIESGHLSLDLEMTAIGPLCDACVRMVRSALSRKCIAISAAVEPPGLACLVDPRRFKQILINLLDNAAKFTAIGGAVRVRVRTSDDGANLVLEVEDNGLGIEEKDLARIFRPFEQADNRLARESSGVGLGLPLVLRLAELHGGGVEVTSTPGIGSCFTVTLPFAKPPAAEIAPVPPGKPASDAPHLHGRKILLVEDNKDTARILVDVLSARGARVDVVTESPKALRKILEFEPDAIFLDIQLPVIDGYTLAEIIRRHDHPRLRAVPILALTALAMPGDRERCIAAGMNAYLPKPFHLDEVIQTLCDHLPKASL